MKQDVTLPIGYSPPNVKFSGVSVKFRVRPGRGKSTGTSVAQARSPGQALELPPMLASDWSRIHLAAL